MADQTDDEITEKIKTVFVPFLKRLISHLEKKQGSQNKIENLRYVYKIFTGPDKQEKLTVYNASKEMLEEWYKKYKNMRAGNTDKKKIDNSDLSEDSQSNTAFAQSKATTISNSSGNSTISIVSVYGGCTDISSQVNQAPQKTGKIYVQDEIEIEPPDLQSESSSNENLAGKWKPVNIKKEKEDTPVTVNRIQPEVVASPKISSTYSRSNSQQVTVSTSAQKESLATKMVNLRQTQEAAKNAEASEVASNVQKPVNFVCASCQFQTTDETDFMKHARTDHRTDLSLWCKQCGRCFSNAGVLVSHIKESNCVKEEMIYRCGVKECVFETPSGQTFVHHLRHCHKGSPFIFCIHCQKIFTLPHCLILHMQNECPFKDKNRKYPPGTNPPPSSTPVAVTPVTPVPAVVKPAVDNTPRVVSTPPVRIAPKPMNTTANSSLTTVSKSVLNVPSNRGRRGTGRRGRRGGRSSRYIDSSESDDEDPDDPWWKPEESVNSQPVRRSARWAKKLTDVANPDIFQSDNSKHQKSEQPAETCFCCPCCDFSAVFKSLLDDHYVTSHKNPNKNACNVCNIKFENVQLFIEHFADHEKNKNKDTNVSAPVPIETETSVASTEEDKSVDLDQDVCVSIPASSMTPIQPDAQMKIPYQTAIHDKVQRDIKLKSFDELKSANDLKKMNEDPKLKHFFKCSVYNCSFTTDDKTFFVNHLKNHVEKKLNCSFCLKEISDGTVLAEHMLQEHGRRFYQCGLCFYRGFSKPHVQIHSKHAHPSQTVQVHKCCSHLPTDYKFKEEEEDESVTTTWPYVCAVGNCKFQTYDPKEFKKHNDLTHRSVSQFNCHYCKVDFISFKRLMSHYHLHGINNFQCTYCVHGSETKDEILLHLCNTHADKPFKVYARASQIQENTNKKNQAFQVVPLKETTVETQNKMPSLNQENQTSSNLIKSDSKVKQSDINPYYPEEILGLEKDFYCRLAECNEQFFDMNEYLIHIEQDHCAMNVPCPYCYAVVGDIHLFVYHLMCHGPNLYACGIETCNQYFWKEEDSHKHMKNIHTITDSDKVITVRHDSSGKKSLLPSMLNIGQKTLKKGLGDNFTCLYCHYVSSNKSVMKNHMYKELFYRRFQCNLCKEKCHSRKETKAHFVSSHTHHNIKCVIESNPEIEFLVKSYLLPQVQAVIKEHTKSTEKPVLNFPSVLSCLSCSTAFSSLKEYNMHLNVCLSKDLYPYFCDYCDTKTQNLVRLKCHTSSEHSGKPLSFNMYPNVLLKDQVEKQMQYMRLRLLKDLVDTVLKGKLQMLVNNTKLYKLELKHYKCLYCSFTDNFRCNVEKHQKGSHKDMPVNVEKVAKDLSLPQNFLLPVAAAVDESSNDGSVMGNDVELMEQGIDTTIKRYGCGYCMKKTCTIEKMDEHVESRHTLENENYTFHYLPDATCEFDQSDTTVYNCAYCSVSQENLFHLHRHCSNLHSAMPFKVSGSRFIGKDKSDIIQCGYCSLKIESPELLQKHCNFKHPNLPVKCVADCDIKPRQKRKMSTDSLSSTSTSSSSAKKIKAEAKSFRCLRCDSTFPSYLAVFNHNRSSHRGQPLEYEGVQSSSSDSPQVQLIHCELCAFVGELKLLDEHLASKHKNRVMCGYCRRLFDSEADLKTHNSSEHVNLTVNIMWPGKNEKFSLQDTDSLKSFESEISSGSARHKKNGVSHYGKKPAPVDMNKLTIQMLLADSSQMAELPIKYLSQLYSLFPEVLVQDCMKQSAMK